MTPDAPPSFSDAPLSLPDHLAAFLRGGHAFEPFESVVDAFPPALRAVVPPGVERSAWQTLEHLRFTQRDILDFARDRGVAGGPYAEPDWPQDYWPPDPAPPDEAAWPSARGAFLADREALESLMRDPQADLFTPLPWGDGQTLLREVLLAAEHTAYHLGQLVLLRGLLEAE